MTPGSDAEARPRVSPLAVALLVAVGLAVVGVSVWAVYPHARAHDFLGIYTAASLARHGQFQAIHEPNALFAAQKKILPGAESVVLFSRPPIYAAILAPISILPYELSFRCWLMFGALGLLGCWVWAVLRFGQQAALFGVLYPPAILGIAHGQDCVLMLGVAICAYALAKRDKRLLSGLVLSLGLLKFHLFLLWPFALAVRREWKMLAGFSAGGALLGLGSLAVAGTDGVSRYVSLLKSRDLEALNPSPYLQASAWGLLENLGLKSLLLGTALAVCLGLLVLYGVRRGSTERLFALTIGGSLVMAPHVYGYDATILLLPLWLALFHSQSAVVRHASRLMSTPAPFAFLAFTPPLAGVTAGCVLISVLLLWGSTFRAPQHEWGR